MQTLPMLFKANKSGSLLQWRIWTEGNKIITEHGQIGGKLQRTEDIIKVGKNLGRTNATTPEQQAEAQAKSKWEKQNTKNGYVQDRVRAAAEETDLKGEECMLAHTYGTLENGIFVPDQNHKIKFPCFVQPKLDGHRCRIREDHSLWSRGHREIKHMPHIVQALREGFPVEVPKFDGELYNHELKEDFEKLTSILKQQKQAHPEHELIEYWIYDVDMPGVPFLQRFALLEELLGHLKSKYRNLRLVETHVANSHEEILSAFSLFEKLGYEGAIIRNMEGKYEGRRSYNLQKLKGFVDAEFWITGIKEGKGKLMGHVGAFICTTKEGLLFDVAPEGENAFKKQCFEDHSLWKGRRLTVRFKRLTKRGVPYGPIGLRIREDI